MDEYSALLSSASEELSGRFGALASPTLSKQETVTFLYQKIVSAQDGADAARVRPRLLLRFEFLIRMAAKLVAILAGSILFRVRALPKGAVFIRTWLVPRSIVAGNVVDDYFRRMVDDLSAERSVIVSFQPMSIADHFRGFRSARKPKNFIISLGLLRFGDVVRLFAEYFRTAHVRLTGQHSYGGRDVTSLINRELDLDYFKLRSFPAYLEMRLAERVKQLEPTAFLYVFENQSWEKTCLRALANTSTKCIGYQSSGFSDRFLNFFPSEADSLAQPFPEVILTVGDLFRDKLRSCGVYPVPVETFAATRFDYPSVGGEYQVAAPRPDYVGRILYAFAVHEYQYAGIIEDLAQVFAGCGIEVVLKVHPLHQRRYARLPLPENLVLWTPEPGKALRDSYDLVLFNDNSFGFESLLQGVKSFEYRCEPVYDETRLWEFDLYDCNMDRARLPALRDTLLAGTFVKEYPVERAEAYLNRAFKPYSSESLKMLRELIAPNAA